MNADAAATFAQVLAGLLIAGVIEVKTGGIDVIEAGPPIDEPPSGLELDFRRPIKSLRRMYSYSRDHADETRIILRQSSAILSIVGFIATALALALSLGLVSGVSDDIYSWLSALIYPLTGIGALGILSPVTLSLLGSLVLNRHSKEWLILLLFLGIPAAVMTILFAALALLSVGART